MTISKHYFLALISLLFLAHCSTEHDHDHSHCKHHHHDELVIGFAGDTMLGRIVNEKLKNNNYKDLWGNLIPELHANDFNIVNLETAITTNNNPVPKVFNFKTDLKNVRALQVAHINVVNNANNHILDFGEQGLIDTLSALDKARIKHVGAGLDADTAQQPLILKKNGISVGILGYTDNEPGWKAGTNKPGTHYIKVGDIETVKKDLKNLRSNVDIVIATIHWGPNMQQYPSKEFIQFAHEMIDAGVDIIHGHSSHVFQGIEIYKDKLIMYDTGDFIDDYAVDHKLRNDQSIFIQVKLTKSGIKKVIVTPILIDDMQVNKAQGQDAQQITERLTDLSAQLNTVISKDSLVRFAKPNDNSCM